MSDAIRASHSSKRDAGVKNRLLGSGRRRGGIWENSTETRVLPYAKRSTGPGSMQETGRSGLVHWDDPEGWDVKLMSIESVMQIKHLILCHLLLSLPSIFPRIRVFSSESVLHIRWPKYWNFSFSISPSKEHPGLISFRMDWLDLLAVQGTLKSLLQHHSSKASILWHSAFFMVQL